MALRGFPVNPRITVPACSCLLTPSTERGGSQAPGTVSLDCCCCCYKADLALIKEQNKTPCLPSMLEITWALWNHGNPRSGENARRHLRFPRLAESERTDGGFCEGVGISCCLRELPGCWGSQCAWSQLCCPCSSKGNV